MRIRPYLYLMLDCDGLASNPEGRKITLSLHATETGINLRPDEPLGSYSN